jgi:hypothetical protein
MSLITNMAGLYIATNAVSYIYKSINNMVVHTAIHNSICLTLNNLTALLTNTKKLGQTDFNNLMSELDVDFKLEIINGFLSDIKTRINLLSDHETTSNETTSNETTSNETTSNELIIYNKSSNNSSNNPEKDPNREHQKVYISNSLNLGLKYLDQSLSNIHMIISNIRSKIEYHQTKYFYYYRGLDLNLDMGKIKLEYQILISRFDLILKICKF